MTRLAGSADRCHPAVFFQEAVLMITTGILQATSPVLRRSLQAGFVFFLAKGCAWLLLAAWLGELL
jgi:hypothetical protein